MSRKNKTVLRRIHLVNWYGFINTTIPLSEDLTLISGENECGKSTILDAIKYAYTGDTQFNKATSGYNTGVGKRNLISYTRCLVDASAGVYARPAEKIPVVYTHIGMEYYDQINEHPFVSGVIIETAAADIRGTYWYVLDGKTFEDVAYVYEDRGITKPYDAAEFQRKYQVQLKNKKDGITLFMQMTGLKIPWQEVPKYQRKLRNIMAYNPAAKIQEFIRESVLEEHNVNFDKLKDARKNIEEINRSLDQIRTELHDLDEILKDFDEHDRKALQLRIDDMKLKYKRLVSCRQRCMETEETIQKNRIACEELKEQLAACDEAAAEIEAACSDAKQALRQLDVSKAILDSRQRIRNCESRLEVLGRQMQELEAFQTCAGELVHRLAEAGEETWEPQMAGRLASVSVGTAEKQHYIDGLKNSVRDSRDRSIREIGRLETELSAVQRECVRQNGIIENCNKNKADYSHAGEQLELIREINREFRKQGIQDEARMACEYVAGLKDEAWRDAIEAFLGVHRYAIIVEPSSFETANRVMDRSGHRYVELVNTRRLDGRKLVNEEDSVFSFLQIRNEIAAAYFKFWLGRIHAAKLSDVPDYDNAMSKEGKLSRNMTVTYINLKKIRSYCLGSEAIELNRAAALRRLKELEQTEAELLCSLSKVKEREQFLREGLELFREYHLGAHAEAAEVREEKNREQQRYRELMEAQKNNAEFMTLSRRAAELEKELLERRRIRDSRWQKKSGLEAETDTRERELKRYEKERKEAQNDLEEAERKDPAAVKTAIREYDGFLAGTSKNGGLMQPATKERNDRRVRELEAELLGLQQTYNNRKQDADRLPVGLQCESSYQKRRGRIWIDDLQGIQQKLKEQTLKYERIFKREFVLNIYETARDARNDISDINKELRKLKFSTKYQFDVRLLRDNSDYARILRYAEYLQETNDMADGQMTLAALAGYDSDQVEQREAEIREIINRIIDKNDMTEMRRFADYRNYMSYEIIINNDEVKDGKLSRQVGYNSGAGTQIPYTLILSAALSMLYNVRVNSVRLIFIDEPFEKMSDHNIRLMLEFFKNQNFQVIFCAPPNKLESIGSECGVIIPVLKISNDNMQIGEVRFHEQSGV